MSFWGYPLPEVSLLTPQYTLFPLITAMWFYDGSILHSTFMGVGPLFAYTLIVMFGFNIQNPVSIYGGQAKTDAQQVLGADCVMALAYAAMGAGYMLVLAAPVLLPFGKHQPVGQRLTAYKMVQRQGVDVYVSAGPDAVNQDALLGSYGIRGLVPGPWHYVFTVLLYLAAVGVPQVLFTWYMGIAGDELLAWMLYLLLGLVFYGLLFVYLYFGGTEPITGPGKAFFLGDPAGNRYGLSKRDVKELERARLVNCAILVVVPTFFQIVGALVQGGTRYWADDVNTNTWVAIGFWLGMLLVLLIMTGVAVYKRRNQKAPASVSNRGNKSRTRRREDNDEDESGDDNDDVDDDDVDDSNNSNNTGSQSLNDNQLYKRTYYSANGHDVCMALNKD